MLGETSVDGILTFIPFLQPGNSITYTALFMGYYKINGLRIMRRYRKKDYNGNVKLAASAAMGDESNTCPNRWLARTLAAQKKAVYTYHYRNFNPCFDMLN